MEVTFQKLESEFCLMGIACTENCFHFRLIVTSSWAKSNTRETFTQKSVYSNKFGLVSGLKQFFVFWVELQLVYEVPFLASWKIYLLVHSHLKKTRNIQFFMTPLSLSIQNTRRGEGIITGVLWILPLQLEQRFRSVLCFQFWFFEMSTITQYGAQRCPPTLLTKWTL